MSRGLYRSTVVAVSIVLCHGAFWTVQWAYVTSDMETGATPIPYLTGQRTYTQYVTHWRNEWPAIDYVNHNAAPDDGMMLIGDYRIFGAKPRAKWNDWFNTPVIADWIRTRNITDFDQLLSSLRESRIRWIIIDEREIALQGPRFIGRLTENEQRLLGALRNLQEPAASRKMLNQVTVLDLAPKGSRP